MAEGLDGVSVVIALILIIGFILFIFTPTINDVREDLLVQMSSDQILAQIILQGFMPFLWIIYLLISVLAIRGAIG